MNDTLFHITCAMAVSQLLFMALSYLLHYHKLMLGRLMGLFSLGLMSYVFLVGLGYLFPDSLMTQIFRAGAMVTPALLWVISRHLFQDNTRIQPAFWAVVTAYIGLRLLGHTIHDGSLPTSGPDWWLFGVLPQSIMAILAAHAIYLAARNRNDDLVEPRRQLRGPFVIIMGLIVMVIVLSGFLLPIINNDIRTIYVTLIMLCALALNLSTFRLHQEASQLIFPLTRTDNVTSIHARELSSKALARKIRLALEEDALYANPQLTIGELARVLSMPEYILRRFINKQLGYRNFNQFLNQCRIDHAARRLRDAGQRRVPISTIAMEVGYNSLSTFNKSFKQLHELTPSEYRTQNAVDVSSETEQDDFDEDEPERPAARKAGHHF
ncbi:MAG: helix-turn-helix transcriptional regulator [Pseudomonadota bacterium]